MNFQKEFDSVPHLSLLGKLRIYDISGVTPELYPGLPSPLLQLDGSVLSTTKVERNLGMLLSSELKKSEETARRARSAARFQCVIGRASDRLAPDVYGTLYTTHILPILEYVQPAFQPIFRGDINAFENFQRQGSKMFWGLHLMKYAERLEYLQLLPLDYRRQRLDLIYTCIILQSLLGPELQRFFPRAEGDARA